MNNMKKSILFLALGFAATTANAQKIQEKAVPIPVKTTFTTTYPKTEVEAWELEDGNYEAKFDYNKIDYSVLYDAKGTVLETEMEIKTTELPKAVSDYIAKNVADKKIKEAAKITDAKGTVTYEAQTGDTDYIFDANGNFISKKEVKEDDKDDEKDEKKK